MSIKKVPCIIKDERVNKWNFVSVSDFWMAGNYTTGEANATGRHLTRNQVKLRLGRIFCKLSQTVI